MITLNYSYISFKIVKKKIKLLIYTLLLPLFLFGQNRYGELTITGGTTYNMFREVYKLPFTKYENTFKFTVGQQLHLDYALVRRLSIGIGFTHQKQVLTIHNYEYFKGPAIITESPIQTTNTTSGYLRILFHLLPIYEDTDEMLDVYWGLAQHLTVYTSTNNSNDSNFYQFPSGAFIFYNVLAGVRFYPTAKIGVHFEASLPTSYTFSAGISFRVFGRDRLIRKGKIKSIFLP